MGLYFCSKCTAKDPTGWSLEIYQCNMCLNTVCTHLMKTLCGKMECWVCKLAKKMEEAGRP